MSQGYAGTEWVSGIRNARTSKRTTIYLMLNIILNIGDKFIKSPLVEIYILLLSVCIFEEEGFLLVNVIFPSQI